MPKAHATSAAQRDHAVVCTITQEEQTLLDIASHRVGFDVAENTYLQSARLTPGEDVFHQRQFRQRRIGDE